MARKPFQEKITTYDIGVRDFPDLGVFSASKLILLVPLPLSPSSRPDSSVGWFTNPLKALYYGLWIQYRWLLLKLLIAVVIVAFFALFIYNLPGYTVKWVLGV
ncbi:Otoferlin [Holothuria leucospilota]|uniref:Otoferlin n=1 Tax=Holothuria leucospilota TaxID=206669 RepID=A0A9Q1H4L9_HOLLE|nr:Otoferlin [Holothuria leucospilota]